MPLVTVAEIAPTRQAAVQVLLPTTVPCASCKAACIRQVHATSAGFLTGHLLGQHPEAFRCGILRNPVLNIALMVYQSDITDW